jgi:hypothetical protein
MSSSMLLELLLDSSVTAALALAVSAATPSVFSFSSTGEYKAYSLSPFSSTGVYALRSELSLATLVRLCSMLVRRYSVLVRRLSVGEEEEYGCGRCWSRLERLDWRRRGGGGGGMLLPVLPPDTLRCVLRVEDTEEVRWMLGAGDEASDSRVLRRGEGGSGMDRGVLTEPDDCASSVLEELVLELPRFASRAPYREGGGGGGGDFVLDIGSGMVDVGVCGASIECCEDIVRFELLRDRFPVEVVFN